MQLETDPEQTLDFKALLVALNQKPAIIRKGRKVSRIVAQRRIEASEPEKPTNEYDAGGCSDLDIRDALCIYSWKGTRFRFTVNAQSEAFMPFMEDLIMRFVPFKVHDILNETEIHRE